MLKVVVTGYSGQLGFDIVRALREKYGDDVEIFTPNSKELNVGSIFSVYEYFAKIKPDAIFHAAAYTNVDASEKEQKECMRVNKSGAESLAAVAYSHQAKLVFVSTDYVFDGEKDEPYHEYDKKNPLNIYGKSKSLAEDHVINESKRYFVIRTSWLFGSNGKNFVKTMLNLAKTKAEINVVDDQIGSPTYSLDLARKIVEIAETNKYGVYHVTNEGYTSWCDFAKKIFELEGIKVKVTGVKTSEYQTKTSAKRPLNSRLYRNNLAKNGFDSLPRWEDALRRFLIETCYEKDPNTGIITFKNGTTATPTAALDAYIIEPKVFGDARGYFEPFFIREYMEALGFSDVYQTNKSMSGKNVLRGLHFQEYPHDQAKVVEVIQGKAIDVIVDLRVGSKTYGKSVSLLLTPYDSTVPGSGRQLFVPRGFAHGFISLEDNTVFQYIIDNKYAPAFENGIRWNDDIINLTWEEIFEQYGINKEELVLSEKDNNREPLDNETKYFDYKKRSLIK